MAGQSLAIIRKHSLPLNLKPIYIGQLAIVESLADGGYSYRDGKFEIILKKREIITPEFLRNYATSISKEVFISWPDFENIQDKINQQLVQLSRTLSVGDPLKNSSRQANLLSLQMANLYNDPFNDELLKNQFQNSKNFSTLLFNNKQIHSDLYKRYLRQKHHYTIAQPLLSSILLMSFIQHTQMFSEKEIQGLFLTSYFKDIGMSFIPREKFELAHLSPAELSLFSEHATNSMRILDGRVPFNKTQLNMIQNHHYLNFVIQSKLLGKTPNPEDELLTGIESALLSSIDILVAMTTERPYRDPISLFKALEFLKQVLQDEYPAEFKSLVIFLKQFFMK